MKKFAQGFLAFTTKTSDALVIVSAIIEGVSLIAKRLSEHFKFNEAKDV